MDTRKTVRRRTQTDDHDDLSPDNEEGNQDIVNIQDDTKPLGIPVSPHSSDYSIQEWLKNKEPIVKDNQSGTDLDEILLAFQNHQQQLMSDLKCQHENFMQKLQTGQRKWQQNAELSMVRDIAQVVGNQVSQQLTALDSSISQTIFDNAKRSAAQTGELISATNSEIQKQHDRIDKIDNTQINLYDLLEKTQRKIEMQVNEIQSSLKQIIEEHSRQTADNFIRVSKTIDDLFKFTADNQKRVIDQCVQMQTENQEITERILHKMHTNTELIQETIQQNVVLFKREPSHSRKSEEKSYHKYVGASGKKSIKNLGGKHSSYSKHSDDSQLRKSRSKSKKRHRRDTSSSTDSSNSSSDSDISVTDSTKSSCDSDDNSSPSSKFERRTKHYHKKKGKLATYNGKERWRVWYNRFKSATEGYSIKEKLSDLLSLMRGSAAEFVFDQLSSKDRKDYSKLKAELAKRFHQIENPKAYGAMFSKRNQKSSETLEEYAAELKRLYNKAHPKRDERTRKEDLLRRLLDGAIDKEAASQVEFVKHPNEIDTAVSEIIMYQQLQKGGKSRLARTRDVETDLDSSDYTDDGNVCMANRGPGRPPKSKKQGNSISKKRRITPSIPF